MKLNEKDLLTLRHFEAGPARVMSLSAVMPKATAYKRVRRLVKGGLLYVEGNKRGLLPAGREALAAAGAESSAEINLAQYVRHIGLAPTVLQRAILTLIASAVVLRQHRVTGSHHASFLLYGKKLTWKSWIARMGCLMVGVDPREFVMNLGVETAGSLLPRRDARGQIVSERNAIRQPVMGLDELGRATGDTLRAVQALLHGDIEIPFENLIFEVLAVPIATMNPKNDKADLAEKLGLDEGTIRRSVIADLSKLELPEEILTEGETLLDRARQLGPATFPAPRWPEFRPTSKVKKQLLKVIDTPERLADIDVVMVALLCTGLTAWFDKEYALRLGLQLYLEVISTLGWLKPGWKDLVGPIRTSMPVQPESCGGAKLVDEASPANPLNYTAKVDAILAICRALNISPEKAAGLMETVRDMGVKHARRLAELDGELAAAGLTVGNCCESLRASRELANSIETPLRRAAALNRGILRTLLRSLPEEADVQGLKGMIAAMARGGEEVAQLRRRARDLRRELAPLVDLVEHHREAEQRAMEGRLEAEDRLAEVESEVADLGTRRRVLRKQCAEMEYEIEMTRAVRQVLAGNTSLSGHLAWELHHALAARGQGHPIPTTVSISPASVREILEALRRVFEPSIVSVFDLPQIIAKAGQDGVHAALKELEEMIAELHENEGAHELQEETLRKAVRRIRPQLLARVALPGGV